MWDFLIVERSDVGKIRDWRREWRWFGFSGIKCEVVSYFVLSNSIKKG